MQSGDFEQAPPKMLRRVTVAERRAKGECGEEARKLGSAISVSATPLKHKGPCITGNRDRQLRLMGLLSV